MKLTKKEREGGNKKPRIVRNPKHGFARNGKKDPFYKKFENIRGRCKYPKHNMYYRYGGRGIKCVWDSFEEFKEDMYESYLEHLATHGAEDTTIDRIDNDGDYSKENCRWSTRYTQKTNRSDTFLIPAIEVERFFGIQGATFKWWVKEHGVQEALHRSMVRYLKPILEKRQQEMVERVLAEPLLDTDLPYSDELKRFVKKIRTLLSPKEESKEMGEAIERYNKAKADGTLDEKFPVVATPSQKGCNCEGCEMGERCVCGKRYCEGHDKNTKDE